MQQHPTCTGLRIRSVRDAHIIFHAARLGHLSIIKRRLDTEERRAVRAGNVYVWEERGPNSRAAGLGIERWTDGIPWSASRVRDEFLFYHEKDRYTDAELSDTDTISGTSPVLSNTDHIGVRYRLVKQTYSVLVEPQIGGQRKWHLTAYFIPDTSGQLLTVDDVPELAACQPPEGMYVSAKLGKGRARDCWTNLGGDRQSDYLLDMHQGTSPPTGYPMYTGYGTPQHDVCTRARAGGTTLQPASWQESPLSPLDLRRPLPPMAVPQLGMAPLPQKPSHSRYLPRSATDDAALRSLRPF